MEYVTLGKSDLKVSRICMGCMGFGNAATGQHSWTVDEETSKSIIKKGLSPHGWVGRSACAQAHPRRSAG